MFALLSPTTSTRREPASAATAATAFTSTLSADQRADLVRERSFANAVRWSNLPQGYLGSAARLGLSTSTLTAQQWVALHELLETAAGPRQHAELRALLDADDYLRDHGGGSMYGREQFTVALLGEPSDRGTWQLQLGGHHLALANTYRDGALVSATPSFRGIEPFSSGPLKRAHKALSALLGSFDARYLNIADIDTSFFDLLLGPGADWAFPTQPEGIPASLLDVHQRRLLLKAIASSVEQVPDADAARITARYERELDHTHVAFAGGTSLRRSGDYVRIDGPTVWIEFLMRDGIVFSSPHPHAVWRDKEADYAGLGS